MLSEEIRLRLEKLPRPLAAPAVRPTRPNLTLFPSEPHDDVDPWAQAEECENESGTCLRFRRDLASISGYAAKAVEERPNQPAWPMHGELAAVVASFPRRTVFLDLETCGFAGSPVFLAGLVWQSQGVLSIDQFFARDYSEERAMLSALWQVVAEHDVLVTFNGKSFDWPTVHDRSTRHHLGRRVLPAASLAESDPRVPAPRNRQAPRPEPLHCDVLHHARRRWKQVLPNCKLQTLERYLCKRVRHNDLSGALVPAAYHAFVRGGDRREVSAILEHNAGDLATLVEVTLRLLSRPVTVAAKGAVPSAAGKKTGHGYFPRESNRGLV